ncbi:carboxylesterase/lipase family protein [Terriglobus tenax]|uniref:carboxylesterase/lipase family protein n=1 Tax=Terriglobus tenax TaxID=1111115 RepID=UPI0021DF9A51|nr:carboxylesterase family protein [Terriglobus tenax]
MPFARRLSLLASTLLLTASSFAAVGPQAKTASGIVEGEPTTDGKIMAFKGIPYAAPPVGKLRWAAPAPVEPWTGIRSAHDFGYHCVQSAVYADMAFHDPGASEDCLTLNVWTPANAEPGKLPVMVWIYGGGFSGGSTSERRQDGQYLAHRNVVVVSMNYRLGIFGFFVHPEATAESPNHAAGNYGLLDQAAALAWVKQNIAAFGGDPSNITIFGESAGSMSVSSQMASPLSKDLFQKAIGESGSIMTSATFPIQTREQREKADTSFALTTYGTTKLSELRRISTEDILRPILASRPAPSFRPVVDGYFFPKSPVAIYAAGEQAHVPLLAGWNADEARGGVVGGYNRFTAEGFTAQVQREFPTRSAEFLKLYSANTPEEAVSSASDYAGDKFIAYSTWRWLEAHTATGTKPVYRYYFALDNPGDRYHTPAAGAFHSDDIEYVFGTLDSRPEAVWHAEDRKLSDQMQLYWTNFARTGDPNGSGLPKWPTYGPAQWQVMHLDANSSARPDQHRERYLFLDSEWAKPASAPANP